MPDAERALWDLRGRVGPDVGQIAHPEKFLHVMGTELLGDVFFQPKPAHEASALIPELRAGLSQIHEAVRSAAYADGVYHGGRYVKVKIASEPKDLLGQTALDLWAGFSDKKLVARVLRKVREANNQVPRGQKAVVVVDIGGLKNLVLLQDELKFEARARPMDFECVSTVVTIAMTSTPTNIRHEFTLALPPFEPVLTRLQRRVVEALLGRGVNQAPDWPTIGSEPSEPSPFGRGAIFTFPLTQG